MARNILLITADQWRADSLGVAGNRKIRTPNIDALAASAVRFERHYTAATPCGPARASIFTGMYPHNHRSVRNGTPLAAHFTNVALELRAAGYEPTLFGYTDTTPDPRAHAAGDPVLSSYEGVLPGFAVGQLLLSNPVDWLTYLEGQGYDVPGPGHAIFLPSDDALQRLDGRPGAVPARFAAEHSDTAWLVRRCIDHLRGHRRAAERPFMVHLAIPKPHPPLIAPAPYHRRYDAADMTPPIPLADDGGHPLVAYHRSQQPMSDLFPYGSGLARDLSLDDILQLRATYYGLVEELDDQLGVLMAAMQALGLWDDTLVVLTSDHGEQLGDHGLFGKLGFYEESQHVPLIIRDPRAPETHGTVVRHLTESVDLFPTLLEWAGLEISNQIDGRSLLPFLGGRTPGRWREATHWTYDFRDVATATAERRFGILPTQCTCSVSRGEQYKYVHFAAALPPLLFDLKDDPDELVNRADDPAYRDVRLECAEELLAWLTSHRDETLSLSTVEPTAATARRHMMPSRA